MKIKYEPENTFIRRTKCPNIKGLKVASFNCFRCEYFNGDDIEKKEINCKYKTKEK